MSAPPFSPLADWSKIGSAAFLAPGIKNPEEATAPGQLHPFGLGAFAGERNQPVRHL